MVDVISGTENVMTQGILLSSIIEERFGKVIMWTRIITTSSLQQHYGNDIREKLMVLNSYIFILNMNNISDP